jgi:glutamate-ammonia-ligase adenylyltransferase
LADQLQAGIGEESEYPAGMAAVRFNSPLEAKANFMRIARRVPVSLLPTLTLLLAESPNPDAALNLLERFVYPESLDMIRSFERHPQLLHYALALFAHSQYLGETLIQNPDLLPGFLREDSLGRVQSVEDFSGAFARFSSRSFETDTSLLLARFKRREYVRIVLRDILGLATLAQITAEISALSDVLIEEALRICESTLRNRYGTPQHYDSENRTVPTRFSVLSLGKLGGNELNYSSDIDLLYIFEDGRDAETTSISGHEFFVRLAQELTDVLGRITREGPPFRIDLRLRPRGSEGELAIQLNRALQYYDEVAHDWELQALIKVRHSAGDQRLARQFIRRVQPFVYRGEINFRAIETALESLHKIKKRFRRGMAGRRLGTAIDVKLDRGGIRDIEFLVQCLQRVYGGAEPWLHSGGTLFSLQKLHDKEHLSGNDFHTLSASYTFLRQVEHRLQMWQGQQTHTLPADEWQLQAIQRSLVAETPDREPRPLIGLVREHMESVAAIYERVIHQQQTVAASPAEEHSATVLHWAEHSDAQLLTRLAVDSPALFGTAASLPVGSRAERNFFRVLGAAVSEDTRYATLMKHASLLERAVPVLAASRLVTDSLIRHPEDIVEVAFVDSPPELLTDTAEPAAPFTQAVVMAELRSGYRRKMLRSCLRDFLCPQPVWQSLQDLTRAADAAIGTAFAASGAPEDCAIFALGRLGTSEFDVFSDADLLLVRGEEVPAEQAASAAAAIVTLLSSYTSDGIVFTVDLRLRPHGGQGEVTTRPSRLLQYFRNEAQPWEALSYTKLRHVAGSALIAAEVLEATRHLHRRFAAIPSFRREVREMRSRLETSVGSERDFKKGWGGFYDIDFIASSLTVERAIAIPATDIVARLAALGQAGALPAAEASALCHAAEFLRTLEHCLRMVYGSARNTLPGFEPDLEAVGKLMRASLGREMAEALPQELENTTIAVREIFDRILVV